MEANVVFVFPLSKVTLDLKEELEKNADYTVYEVESPAEYTQLLGILESSFTLITDPSKAASCLEKTKAQSITRLHYQILVYKTAPSGLSLSRMQKNGLNESLPEFITLKSLQQKLALFLKNLQLCDASVIKGGKKSVIDTVSQQRVERLVADRQIQASDLHLKSEIKNVQELELKISSPKVSELNGIFKKINPVSNLKPLNEPLGLNERDKLSKSTNKFMVGNKSIDPKQNKSPSRKLNKAGEDSFVLTEKVNSLLTSGSTSPIQLPSSEEARSSEHRSFKTNFHTDELCEYPEIDFFPRAAGYDAAAFYLEILFGGYDREFKKKFITMSLSKVHHCILYFADETGKWNELAPEKLQDLNPQGLKSPIWYDEGRSASENILIFPILQGENYHRAVAVVVNGAVSQNKMAELEFWCYLGRPLWI